MYLGVKATTGEREVIVASRNGVWLTRTGGRQREKDGERSNVETIVAVPWSKNEADAKMDVERPEGEVVMMDKDYKKKTEDGRTCSGTIESVRNT